MDSPRGRIYLMKLASEGNAPINPQWVSHFDSCLGCSAPADVTEPIRLTDASEVKLEGNNFGTGQHKTAEATK